MEWWKNQVILTWLSILLIIIATFLGLYFQSDKFAKSIQLRSIKFKLFIKENRKIFFVIFYIIFSIYLLLNELIIPTLLFYALFMTIWAYLEHIKKREISTLVSCRLGDLKSEKGLNGLRYIRWDDGDAVRELKDNNYIRRTNVSQRQRYIYFVISEDAKKFRNKEIYIIAEYFDSSDMGNFHLHYDSSDKNHPNKNFKGAQHHVNFTGSNTWKIAIWKIDDGNFKKSQQGAADFRFRCGRISSLEHPEGKPGVFDIYIRKVTVVAAS